MTTTETTPQDVLEALAAPHLLTIDLESMTATDARGWGFGVRRINHRLHIRGVFPEDMRQWLYLVEGSRNLNLEITASPMRTPESIAKDVARRLIPSYDALFSEVAGIVRQRVEYERSSRELAVRISDALPGTTVAVDRNDVRFRIGGAYGTFEAGDGTVALEARRLPQELAIAIAKLIAEHAKGES